VFPLEVLCDRTFYVNKRFVGGVVGSTEYFKRIRVTVLAGRKVAEARRCIGGSGARTFDKTPHINIYPEVMFRKRLSIKDATHVVISKRMSKSVRRRLARSIRTFKLWSMRVGEVEGGWKDFKSFFLCF
jgi:CII-binding regulator of phage lambda lysogenization HflD